MELTANRSGEAYPCTGQFERFVIKNNKCVHNPLGYTVKDIMELWACAGQLPLTLYL